MSDRTFGWDFPPGVTGNEPQITGEWPCEECAGTGLEPDTHDETCQHCDGTGLEPEEGE